MALARRIAEVEDRAWRCLTEGAGREDAHELARAALALVQALRKPGSPYRDAAEPRGGAARPDEAGETAARVALERALEECQQRLARAEQELAQLRART